MRAHLSCVGPLCVADGTTLTPSQKDVVIRSMLTFYAAHAGGLAVSWCLHTAKLYPCLTGVLRMMLDELKLGEPWDVCRVEEEIPHSQLNPSPVAYYPPPSTPTVPTPTTPRTPSPVAYRPRTIAAIQVCCDWLKILVGVMIESGDVPGSAALQGFYDDTLLRAEGETSTGFPRVPVV